MTQCPPLPQLQKALSVDCLAEHHNRLRGRAPARGTTRVALSPYLKTPALHRLTHCRVRCVDMQRHKHSQ